MKQIYVRKRVDPEPRVSCKVLGLLVGILAWLVVCDEVLSLLNQDHMMQFLLLAGVMYWFCYKVYRFVARLIHTVFWVNDYFEPLEK